MKHPIPLICRKCGGKLKLKRYEQNGVRFRRYYCRQCGFAAIFRREKNIYF